VEYDEHAWVETTDKVAGQVWITTSRPGEIAYDAGAEQIKLIPSVRIRNRIAKPSDIEKDESPELGEATVKQHREP
jgi:hypothetical protein